MASVSFNSGAVVGLYRREGPRFALAFTAKQDGPFSGAVAWLSGVDAQDVTLSEVACYGRLGARIDNPDLKLE
jgi:hypothetical protein